MSLIPSREAGVSQLRRAARCKPNGVPWSEHAAAAHAGQQLQPEREGFDGFTPSPKEEFHSTRSETSSRQNHFRTLNSLLLSDATIFPVFPKP